MYTLMAEFFLKAAERTLGIYKRTDTHAWLINYFGETQLVFVLHS
jgi:hypothetical protein